MRSRKPIGFRLLISLRLRLFSDLRLTGDCFAFRGRRFLLGLRNDGIFDNCLPALIEASGTFVTVTQVVEFCAADLAASHNLDINHCW